MSSLFDNFPRPALVGAARGLAEALVVGAIGGLAVWLTGLDLGEWNFIIPVGQMALRTAEGFADERIDPDKERGKLGQAVTGSSVPRSLG